MAEQQQKRKTSKKQHPKKYVAQFSRTARNTRKDHERHAVVHPNDAQAASDWKAHPIKTSK